MRHHENIRHVNMHFSEGDNHQQGFLFIAKSISMLRWSTPRVVVVSFKTFPKLFLASRTLLHIIQ